MAYENGMYRCRVTGQGFFKLDNEKKTEYFGLAMVPIGRYAPGSGEGGELLQCDDWPRTVRLWLTAKAIDITGEQLLELGWDGQRFVDLDPATDGFHDFSGKEVTLTCSQEQVGDKVYDNFSFPRRSKPTGNGPESDSDIAVKLDRLMGNKSKPKATTKAKAKAAVVAEVPDDEVPF
jgi:hypothetical protein